MAEPNLVDHEARIRAIEKSVDDMNATLASIKEELASKRESDAKLVITVQATSEKIDRVDHTVTAMNDKLLNAILEDRRDERESAQEIQKKDIAFYQRIVLYCVAALVTVLLAAFGVKEILF